MRRVEKETRKRKAWDNRKRQNKNLYPQVRIAPSLAVCQGITAT